MAAQQLYVVFEVRLLDGPPFHGSEELGWAAIDMRFDEDAARRVFHELIETGERLMPQPVARGK